MTGYFSDTLNVHAVSVGIGDAFQFKSLSAVHLDVVCL